MDTEDILGSVVCLMEEDCLNNLGQVSPLAMEINLAWFLVLNGGGLVLLSIPVRRRIVV